MLHVPSPNMAENLHFGDVRKKKTHYIECKVKYIEKRKYQKLLLNKNFVRNIYLFLCKWKDIWLPHTIAHIVHYTLLAINALHKMTCMIFEKYFRNYNS